MAGHAHFNLSVTIKLMKKNIIIASAAVAATGLTMYFTKKKQSDHNEFVKLKLNKKSMFAHVPSAIKSNAYLYDLAIYDDRPE